MDWRCGSSDWAAALQVQSPEFKPQTHPPKKFIFIDIYIKCIYVCQRLKMKKTDVGVAQAVKSACLASMKSLEPPHQSNKWSSTFNSTRVFSLHPK
jgi:hypothetical protein